MGNAKSSTSCKPLAITAVARQLKVQRYQIIVLRDTLARFANSLGMVNHDDYLQALKLANVSKIECVEIFNLLYTMWETEGEDNIPYKAFCVGIAPLACPDGKTSSIIRFILHVYDQKLEKTIDANDLSDLLKTINKSVSHFGDLGLKSKEIKSIVRTIFDNGETLQLSHEDCTQRLSDIRQIKRFASGRRNYRVGFKKDLVTVFEYSYEAKTNSNFYVPQFITEPINAVGSLLKANFEDFSWSTEDIGYGFSSFPPMDEMECPGSPSAKWSQPVVLTTDEMENRMNSFEEKMESRNWGDEEEKSKDLPDPSDIIRARFTPSTLQSMIVASME